MRRAVALAAGAAVALAAAPASALFGEQAASATGTFATATLAPATAPQVSWTCPAKKAGYTATVTWTASASPFATGYEVEVAADLAGPWAPLTTTAGTSATETGVTHRDTRAYRITALAHQWRSTPAVVTSRAPNPSC